MDTQQNRTLTSSMACTAVPALPNTVTNSRLQPVDSDASLVEAEETESATKVTTFIDGPSDDRQRPVGREGDDCAEIRPKNARPAYDGPVGWPSDDGGIS